MTINRSVVRKQFAGLLSLRLAGVAIVYEYQAGDFRGQSPVVIVTSATTRRGNSLNADGSTIRLEVHTFVLYALRPVQSSANATAGSDAIILLDDTSLFTVGQDVIIEDDDNHETAIVSAVDTNVSITVSTLQSSYTTPNVFSWHETQSEDQIDFLEHEVSDEVRVANDSDIWLSVVPSDESTIDMVDVGGNAYRHETIFVNINVEDY